MKETKLWNKLVRDRIPEYLKKEGIDSEVEVVKDKVRFLRLLIDKLEEEAQEAGGSFRDADLLEELADVESVIDGILKTKGWTRAELKKQQDKKDDERGGFEKGIFLIQTIEKIKEEKEDE